MKIHPFKFKTIGLADNTNWAVSPDKKVYKVLRNNWFNIKGWRTAKPIEKKRVLKVFDKITI